MSVLTSFDLQLFAASTTISTTAGGVSVSGSSPLGEVLTASTLDRGTSTTSGLKVTAHDWADDDETKVRNLNNGKTTFKVYKMAGNGADAPEEYYKISVVNSGVKLGKGTVANGSFSKSGDSDTNFYGAWVNIGIGDFSSIVTSDATSVTFMKRPSKYADLTTATNPPAETDDTNYWSTNDFTHKDGLSAGQVKPSEGFQFTLDYGRMQGGEAWGQINGINLSDTIIKTDGTYVTRFSFETSVGTNRMPIK